MIAVIALTLICVFFLIRSFFILIGLYKEPILLTFEEYGPDEKLYLPLLPVSVWAGALIFMASLWSAQFRALSFGANCVGVLILVAAAAGYHYYAVIAKYHFVFLRFPRWYHELRERTTRYERRRIAYMWLHLPLRLRITYNSSDRAFSQWADFVIMGTIREEEMNPKDEEFFYTRH